jgi:hypothetical protein
MSSEIKEWAVVIVFLLCFPIFTVSEALWLVRRTQASFSRSLLYSFATNLFACLAGFFVSFIILGVILAMAWDGSLENVPAGGFTIWAALIVAVCFPLVLLIFSKRLANLLFKLPLSRPWLFSILASLLFYIAILGFPIAMIVLI